MDTAQKINAFVKLGEALSAIVDPKKSITLSSAVQQQVEAFSQHIQNAYHHNGWFTADNVDFALKAWSQALVPTELDTWLKAYGNNKEIATEKMKRVGVIMAGNIPLAGLHDMLCVLISGNVFVGKLSSSDNVLMPALAAILVSVEPGFKERVFFTEGTLKDIDAVIATGSNNTSRYFEYYFGKYPHIIRKNRNSVAVLNGNETIVDLEGLGRDVFQYFGLGCRSVSKLFVPSGYDLDNFFKAIFSYKEVVNNKKYGNNYDYNMTLLLMHKAALLDNGFLLLKEDASMISPVGVLYYEYYSSVEVLKDRLRMDRNNIQCVVSMDKIADNVVGFGQAQHPRLWDYADGVDTMKFLACLN